MGVGEVSRTDRGHCWPKFVLLPGEPGTQGPRWAAKIPRGRPRHWLKVTQEARGKAVPLLLLTGPLLPCTGDINSTPQAFWCDDNS